ncbi:MAG: NHLP family bacteriocin export ABC transporter peptidase/permease/ATPase subunit [Treponema sp.]|nr:NHLP family bacteriocin export ABC transporter peptidase/permease/ATPase subunit [Treponema sp.]
MPKKTKTPTVLQMEALECGAACLAMVLGHYKKYVSLELLRSECGVSRDGTKASSLIRVAKKYGLEAKGWKMEINKLREVQGPAILFWNFNHFVVFERFKKNKVVINDPASGRRVVDEDEFDEAFTGVVLTFEKASGFKEGGSRPRVWDRLKKRLAGLGSIFTFLGFLSALFLIPGFVYPAFSRFFVDEILVKNSTGFLKPLIALMLVFCLANAVLQAVQSLVLVRFQARLSLTSASKFIERLLRMPPQFFVQRLHGELCGRIASCDSISALVSSRLISVAIKAVSSVFFLVLMFLYDVPLAALSLVLTLVTAAVFKLTSERIKNKSLKIQLEAGKLMGTTMSGIEMIESIKASGSENDFFMQWSGQQAKVLLEKQRLVKTNMANSIAPQVVSSVQSILVLTVGALRVMDGQFTVGMLAAFQILLSHFSGPINSFFGLGAELLSASADMQRIDDVMEYPLPKIFADDGKEGEADKNVAPIQPLEGRVSVKNVSFGYSAQGEPFIKDFSLELEPGKRVALVGATASGKSTIGKLLAGLYEPWSGEILFDGKPLTQIDKASFSASVSSVNQSIAFFEGTVKDNITMWDESISNDDVMRAAKDACIHDVITSRQGGYNSKIEEDGKNFSGGQRQRLEIARALATNPRLIIMDEATSSLDALTELEVSQNIKERGAACVIIAHRLSTIRDCDEIIVLDKGAVAQRGSHQQLMEEGGLYKELVATM